MPLNRTKVLCHLSIPTTPPATPSRLIAILQAITSSPPDSATLQAANTAFNASVMSGNPLDTSTRKYAKGLTKATEQLAAQVAILRKEKNDQKEALSKRRRQRSGKRAVIKGHFVLTTAEIRDKVKAAELEALRKKACKGPSQKCKRQATPSEDEVESTEESTEESDSSLSDCIIVSRCRSCWAIEGIAKASRMVTRREWLPQILHKTE
ncbi:MAG: hypothetical protein M1813_007906 [Trichoglossum hirsutum]|nr:MAG: hypothetical protein M1813_007906 [Trichoglossum hirsutum]